MKPARFDYLRAGGAEEAVAALAEAGDAARLLAGGQSLMPMLNMRLVQPEILVDIGGIVALQAIEIAEGALEIGAGVTQAMLGQHASLTRDAPLVATALPHLGHFQTRNRGTVCGSLAHADPSAELPLCLVALGGDVVLRSAKGQRVVAAEDFLLGALTTACEPDEMIAAARLPLAVPGAGYAFDEVSLRHGDFAIASIAAVATRDTIRVAVGGVADRPHARDWPDLDGSALDDALNEFAWALEARDDPQASARYRRELVRRIGRRTVEEAKSCRA